MALVIVNESEFRHYPARANETSKLRIFFIKLKIIKYNFAIVQNLVKQSLLCFVVYRKMLRYLFYTKLSEAKKLQDLLL